VLKHRQTKWKLGDVKPVTTLRMVVFSKSNSFFQKNAKEAWTGELARGNECVTTYNGLHAQKILDEPTHDRVRPSSVNRLNNPHPPK